MSESDELLSAVREIRQLIQLMAEPAIAQRDEKLRDELKRIVGNSAPSAKAVFLMDGKRIQAELYREAGMQKSHLSTLVKQLRTGKLLTDNPNPTLAITIPSNFFEAHDNKS